MIYLLKNMFRSSITLDIGMREEKKYDITVTDGGKIISEPRTINVSRELDVNDFLEKISILFNLPEKAEKLTVGVDPGVRIGAAALCSNVLLTWRTFRDIDALVDWIERIVEITRLKEVEVKVGKGWRSDEIIGKILESKIGCVRLIDERNTTRGLKLKQKLDREVLSAVRIALKA